MKHVSLTVVAVLLPLLVSCRSTTSPSTETAHVIGRAELRPTSAMTPSSKGITVTAENTSFSAVTDDSGMFEFKNIPEGTYNIRFSKAGFGDVYWYSKSIPGGGNAPVYWTENAADNYNSGEVWLTQRPNVVMTLQSVSMFDSVVPGMSAGDRALKVTGSVAGNDRSSVAVFLSHHSNVSSTPGTYDDYVLPYSWGSEPPEVRFDSTSRSFEALIDLNRSQLWNDFHSGDSVYIACYAAPPGVQGFSGMPSGFSGDYYDPINKINVLTSVDQTQSPVIGIKIP